MGETTGIEWTDATWNPTRGCTRVSDGCKHCYAERAAMRMSGPGGAYEGLVEMRNGHPAWTGKVVLDEKALLLPLRWRKPRRIFVNSMSDLFHEGLSAKQIDCVWVVMTLCPRHYFQVLTKRPEVMRAYCGSDATLGRVLRLSVEQTAGLPGARVSIRNEPDGLCGIMLPNVWLGFSAEDQANFDTRWAAYTGTPAAVTMVSLEPLLGPIILPRDFLALGSRAWVIAGAESGPGARPAHPDWFRRVRDDCKAAGVPFFMKQLSGPGGRPIKDMADFPADLRIREYPTAAK